MISKMFILIVSLVMLSLASGLASAASFDLKVELLQEVSTCPTITADAPPLNKDDVPVYIQNFYEFADTFKLSLELPSGWQGFVEPNFIVASNQKKLIDPMWITVPDVAPGVYKVTIKAKSGQTGNEISKTFDVRVLSCHHVEITPVEAYKEVCSEEPETATVKIRVANQGLGAETYTLSVYQSGNIINWATGLPSINVPAGEDTVLDFNFNQPSGVVGEQKFTIVARSTSSYAEDSADVTLKFKDCYSFTAALDPKELSGCSGETAAYKLTLTNTGGADTYSITAPAWVTVEKTLKLDKNEKKTLVVTATSSEKGRHAFEITIDPAKETATQKVTGDMVVDECRGIAIVVTPENASLCSGDRALFKAMIKNTGGVDETVELSTDYGLLETDSVVLKAKEVRMVDLVVETKNFTGNKAVRITAKSGLVEDSVVLNVFSENCHGSDLTVTPQKFDFCACETGEVTAEVKNTGKLDDVYTVSLGNMTKELNITAGATKTVKLGFTVPCDAVGDYTEKVMIKSDYTTAEKEIKVSLQNATDCYAVMLYNGDYVEVQSKKSFAVPITVKNTGQRADSYTFTVEGPTWVYIEPLKAMLEPGEEDMVFVYISPPYDVLKGEYTAKIFAESKNSGAVHTIVLNVTEGITGTVVPSTNVTEPVTNATETPATNNVTEPPTENETQENVTLGEDGVVFNASVNATELPTAKIIQLEKTTRLIIVGVIVAAIILILIIRFMTLVK